jgi:hypothetical protein
MFLPGAHCSVQARARAAGDDSRQLGEVVVVADGRHLPRAVQAVHLVPDRGVVHGGALVLGWDHDHAARDVVLKLLRRLLGQMWRQTAAPRAAGASC